MKYKKRELPIRLSILRKRNALPNDVLCAQARKLRLKQQKDRKDYFFLKEGSGIKLV